MATPKCQNIQALRAGESPCRRKIPRETPEEAEERRQAALRELAEEYDRRLRPIFDSPNFAERVDRMMDAQGRTKKRPKAGETF